MLIETNLKAAYYLEGVLNHCNHPYLRFGLFKFTNNRQGDPSNNHLLKGRGDFIYIHSNMIVRTLLWEKNNWNILNHKLLFTFNFRGLKIIQLEIYVFLQCVLCFFLNTICEFVQRLRGAIWLLYTEQNILIKYSFA